MIYRDIFLETNLSERYNDGLVPAPKSDSEPKRLRPPAWRPTPAQVTLARGALKKNLLILAFILLLIASLVEWLAR
ncbi:MAG TPA: hypothetical protein DCG54_11320 [Anaerolineae bacterium]|nr:hypothetical protein [Anaerolineae bacterium]